MKQIIALIALIALAGCNHKTPDTTVVDIDTRTSPSDTIVVEDTTPDTTINNETIVVKPAMEPAMERTTTTTETIVTNDAMVQ